MKKSKRKLQKQEGHNNFYRSSGLTSIGLSTGNATGLTPPPTIYNRELRRKMNRVLQIREKRFAKNNPGVEW